MQKLILTGGCVMFLASGCGGGGDGQTPDQVTVGFVAAWNRHDAAAVCAYYTDRVQRLYAQQAANLVTSGPNTCVRFLRDSLFKTDPGARWKALRVTRTNAGQPTGNAVNTNTRGPLIQIAIPLVRDGDSWRVDGTILVRHP
jgi:hypothetical protein